MLETCELLWDLNIELGHRDNINAKAKSRRRGFLRKIISNSPWSYPTNYKDTLLTGRKKKKQERKKGRKTGGRKERKEEKEDADTTWITEILGTKI